MIQQPVTMDDLEKACASPKLDSAYKPAENGLQERRSVREVQSPTNFPHVETDVVINNRIPTSFVNHVKGFLLPISSTVTR